MEYKSQSSLNCRLLNKILYSFNEMGAPVFFYQVFEVFYLKLLIVYLEQFILPKKFQIWISDEFKKEYAYF